MYAWKINPEIDKSLNFSYNLDKLAQKLHFLNKPWIWKYNNPRILIIGGDNWLAHYIVHILTENIGIGEILSIDTSPRPLYLSNNKRYQEVRYIHLKDKFKEIKEIIQSFRPQIIFHTHYIWDLNFKNILSLYETNNLLTELVCESALNSDVSRVILFSDSSIYSNGKKEIASEDEDLSPSLILGKSFKDLENIALSFHKSNRTAIYILRIPLLYGKFIPHGINIFIKLILNGLLLGPFPNSPKISIISGKDLALASFLIAIAPHVDYNIFNISSGEIELNKILKKISEIIPRRKIFGIETKLAHIIKFGYQEDMYISKRLWNVFSKFSEDITEFFNYLRFEKKTPLISKNIVDYFFSLRPLSYKRIYNTLGWKPEFSIENFKEYIQNLVKDYYNSEEIQIFIGDYQDNKNNKGNRIKKIEEIYNIIDTSTQIIEELSRFKIENNEDFKVISLPLLNIEIDIKSLWILEEKFWSFLGRYIIKSDNLYSAFSYFKYRIEQTNKNSLIESIINIIRYKHLKSYKLFPNNFQERIKWLTLEIGSLNRKKIKEYINVIFISYIILKIEDMINFYKPLLQLLPNKNFGILLFTEIGDIGILFKIKESKVNVEFPRKIVEDINKVITFKKKLIEFQKITKSHLTLGVRLDKLLEDLFSNNFIKNFLDSFGKEYILPDPPNYYKLLGKAMLKTNINIYLFLNQSNKISFGIKVKDRDFELLDENYIKMINVLLEEIKDFKEVINLISEASEGKEEIAFFKIKTIRKILGGMIAPSRLKKLIFKLLERASVLNDLK